MDNALFDRLDKEFSIPQEKLSVFLDSFLKNENIHNLFVLVTNSETTIRYFNIIIGLLYYECMSIEDFEEFIDGSRDFSELLNIARDISENRILKKKVFLRDHITSVYTNNSEKISYSSENIEDELEKIFNDCFIEAFGYNMPTIVKNDIKGWLVDGDDSDLSDFFLRKNGEPAGIEKDVAIFSFLINLDYFEGLNAEEQFNRLCTNKPIGTESSVREISLETLSLFIKLILDRCISRTINYNE